MSVLRSLLSRGPPPEADPATLSAFRADVESAMVQSAFNDEYFLPEGKIRRLVTRERVSKLLPHASPSLLDYVCQDARKVFLTVLWHRRDGLQVALDDFYGSGFTDDYLPIDEPKARDGACGFHSGRVCTHGKALDVFHSWELFDVSLFHGDQWIFCAPVFDASVRWQELRARCILPFTWVSGDEKDGHFSTIFQAKLHSDHHRDDSDLRKGAKRDTHVALKRFKSLQSELGYNVQVAWEREASALHQIGELRHKHLISRYGAFKRGTDHFIMYEWPDGGTLREVWQKEAIKGTELNADRIMEVLEQLVGLAGALSRLHNTNTNTKTAIIMSNTNRKADLEPTRRSRTLLSPRGVNVPLSTSLQVPLIRFHPKSTDNDYDTGDNSDDTNEEHWRHGDLKPENILQFKDSTSTWLGTLKIADLGLAKQHAFAISRRDEHTQRKYTTPQYEAPEAITNRTLRVPKSRRYDVWSMGCIILEFVIWLLFGYDGLDRFYKERAHINTLRETLYFTVDSNETTAQVSNIAKKWMEYILQFDPECNGNSPTVIGDLIKLVKNRLLVVPIPREGMTEQALKECRADAWELEASLSRIMRIAQEDGTPGRTYLFTRSSRENIQVLHRITALTLPLLGAKSPSVPMRLIDVDTLRLHESRGFKIPDYAILSHTWGDEEVTFQDWQNLRSDDISQKAGFAKIRGACAQAAVQGFKWLWVDTNCIDKTSSAELSEAINAMFEYYEQSKVCFAYLSDVPSAAGVDRVTMGSQVAKSRWFSRGWTLQELLAPKRLIFFAADWTKIGEKDDAPDWTVPVEYPLLDIISNVTGIDRSYLSGSSIKDVCVAKKMSWLARRTTTRVEDMSYCMLGIFGINMPLLYGEGTKAFIRLQEEIIKTTNDHTIFCWNWDFSTPDGWASLLAPSPIHFWDAGSLARRENKQDEISIFSMTNAGLSIRLPVLYAVDSYFLVLEAGPAMSSQYIDSAQSLCIPVVGEKRGNVLYVTRAPYPVRPAVISRNSTGALSPESFLVMRTLSSRNWRNIVPSWTRYPLQIPFFLAFDSRDFLDSWCFQPSGNGFDRAFSTIMVELKHESADPLVESVGVALVGISVSSPHPDQVAAPFMHAYIFVGIKFGSSRNSLFTQIFTKQGDGMSGDDLNDALKSLKEQAFIANQAQEGYFSTSLGVCLVIDTMNNFETSGERFFVLHLSRGERARCQGYGTCFEKKPQEGIFKLPGLS